MLTQVHQTNDVDLTCYKTLPTKSVTCLQVGPMSLEWPVALPAGSDLFSLSSSHEDPNDEHPEEALPTPPHLRWRRDTLQPPHMRRGSLDRNTCVHTPDGGLRCVTWNTGGPFGSTFPHNFPGNRNIIVSDDISRTTTSSAFKKCMGRMSFSRPFRYWLRDSGFMVRLYQAMRTEHPHTRRFLDTFILVHTSHCGSRCRTTCLHKTCSSTCHHMSERLLFPCFVFFLCLSCLYVLSLFYLFSVPNFNSHDVEIAEH